MPCLQPVGGGDLFSATCSDDEKGDGDMNEMDAKKVKKEKLRTVAYNHLRVFVDKKDLREE